MNKREDVKVFIKDGDSAAENKSTGNRINTKAWLVIIFIITIVALFVGYQKATRKLTYKEYRNFGNSEGDLTDIIIQSDNDELRQTFDMPYDIVTSIAIKIGTFARDNNSEWNVYLYETGTDQKVYEGHFNASLIPDNDYYEIKFKKNVRVGQNQKYTIVIRSQRVDEDSALAFYIDTNPDTAVNDLYHAREKISGQLVARIYGGDIDYWWLGMYWLIVIILFLTAIRGWYSFSKNKNVLNDKVIQVLLIGIVFFVLRCSFSVGEVFSDESDNLRGGLIIANGGILYKDYVTQHTPVVYYLCAFLALLGAKSTAQFRLSYYVVEAVIWAVAYRRYSSSFGNRRIALIPILEAICISTVVGSAGFQILSDGWQGMMFVILLLEFLKYNKERTLDWSRCIIISACIWGSFGAAFLSAYSLAFLFLIFCMLEIRTWQNEKYSWKLFVRRYYKLFLSIVLPLLITVIYFKKNGALRRAFDQCYVFNREVYPKYNNGLGEKSIQPFINGIQNFFGIISDNFKSIMTAAATNGIILQLIIMVMAVAILIKLFYKGKRVESFAILLMMIFAATRGYGFHGLAAWYIAVMTVAMNSDMIKEMFPKMGMAATGLVGIVLFSTYVGQVGGNLLYEPSSVSELEANVVELTEKDQDKNIYLDAYSCDSLYLYYKNRKPVNAAVYMLPWYMDWYERDDINALEEYRPRVAVYNEDRNCWDYTHYNNEFDRVIKEKYTRLGDTDSGWKYSVWVRKEE